MAPPSSTELSEDHEEWLREHLGDFRDADDTKAKEDIVKDVTAKFCKKFSIPDRGAKAWHKVGQTELGGALTDLDAACQGLHVQVWPKA